MTNPQERAPEGVLKTFVFLHASVGGIYWKRAPKSVRRPLEFGTLLLPFSLSRTDPPQNAIWEPFLLHSNRFASNFGTLPATFSIQVLRKFCFYACSGTRREHTLREHRIRTRSYIPQASSINYAPKSYDLG